METNIPLTITNKYTEAYEKFKLTPDEDRLAYCEEIMKTPQDDDTLTYPNKSPTFYDKIEVVG